MSVATVNGFPPYVPCWEHLSSTSAEVTLPSSYRVADEGFGKLQTRQRACGSCSCCRVCTFRTRLAGSANVSCTMLHVLAHHARGPHNMVSRIVGTQYFKNAWKLIGKCSHLFRPLPQFGYYLPSDYWIAKNSNLCFSTEDFFRSYLGLTMDPNDFPDPRSSPKHILEQHTAMISMF